MPKCSAAASMTSRAAPTTSGPMPSPGRSSMSNESLMADPPGTRASTPATPFRPGLMRLLAAPRPVPHRLSRLLPTVRGRCSAESLLQTPLVPQRRAGAADSGTTSDPPHLPVRGSPARLTLARFLSVTDGPPGAVRLYGRPPPRRPAARTPLTTPGSSPPPARARRRVPARARRIGACVVARSPFPVLAGHQVCHDLWRLDGEYPPERPVALREIAREFPGLPGQPRSIEEGHLRVQAFVTRWHGLPSPPGCYGATCASHLAPTMPAV